MLRLAVVVPTLDEERLLPRLLARLVAGEGAGDRADTIVVADGGSTDETVALARASGARVVAAARGRGRQLAAGAGAAGDVDVLLFLHADALPRKGALALVRAAFADEELHVACLRQRIAARAPVYRLIERAADARARAFSIVLGDSGLAVRRAAYESVGGFAPLSIFEDVDLSRRLARAGMRARLLEQAVLEVSPRRWEREGILRCTLRNWILTAGYFAGVDPERLARSYPPERNGGPMRNAGRTAAGDEWRASR